MCWWWWWCGWESLCSHFTFLSSSTQQAPAMIQSNRSNLYQWGKLENIHEAVQLQIWGDFV